MALTNFNNPLYPFDNFEDALFDPFFAVPKRNQLSQHHALVGNCHVHEDETKYTLSFDVPGVKASDIKMELKDNVIHLSGSRKVKTQNSVSESKFERRFTLGENVDVEGLKANLADGVLEVRVPKKQKKEPETRQITITQGTPEAMAMEEEPREK